MKYTQKAVLLLLSIMMVTNLFAQEFSTEDQKVLTFLESQKNKWRDWNVPYDDGKVLYDLIVKNNYKTIVEIGTSTGHSTIWLAMAARKTGGKVITLEIDAQRRGEAVANFEHVGLMDYIDSRLTDAHKAVKELDGPIDFVFLDADKTWYTQYFLDLRDKIPVGGCFTAHNVLNSYSGIQDFLDYIESRKDFVTTIDKSSSSGLSISYKREIP